MPSPPASATALTPGEASTVGPWLAMDYHLQGAKVAIVAMVAMVANVEVVLDSTRSSAAEEFLDDLGGQHVRDVVSDHTIETFHLRNVAQQDAGVGSAPVPIKGDPR